MGMIIVSRHVIVASSYLNGTWHKRQPLGECLISLAIKTCEAPENPHQDGEHIPWKMESGDKTAAGWVEISSKKFTSHNEVVDQAKYFLILFKILGKGGGGCIKPSSGVSSHQLPFPTEKTLVPPLLQSSCSLTEGFHHSISPELTSESVAPTGRVRLTF